MPKRPNFEPTHTRYGYVVNLPSSISATGSRERKFFADKKEAVKFAAGIRARYHAGERSGVISKAAAMDAAEAMRILKPHGLSLTEAAKDVSRRMDAAGSKEIFKDRYDWVLPMGEAYWSDRYARDMESLPRWIPESFMQLRCAAITPDVIRKALMEGGAIALSTIENRSRYISAILNYKPRHRRQTEIEIMSQKQVKAMFDACLDHTERWAVALMIYAGIRPSVSDGEMTRLDWADITDKIYISKEVSKTNSERFIPILPALANRIADHPDSGTVIPSNWKRRYALLRKAAKLVSQDEPRHTFASNFLAAHDEAQTKAAMGHSAGSRTLFKHYRRAITEEQGKAFFGL